jgi:diguanylate cyclase (GGDEF)-like protein
VGLGWRARSAAFYGVAVQILLIALLGLAIIRFSALRHDSTAKYQVAHFSLLQRDMLSDMLDEETGMRGYVATRDAQFLEVYRAAEHRLIRDRARLQTYRPSMSGVDADLTRWDVQQRHLHRYFSTQISLTRNGRQREALSNLARGKRMFDGLRTIDAGIETRGETQLAALFRHTQGVYAQTITIALALEALVVLSLFAVLAVTGFAKTAHANANEDTLTGVGNRRMALRALKRSLAENAEAPGLLYMDLDGFKKINDTHGHASGDAILIEVAWRLKRLVRTADTVARLGGDEFLCIMTPPVMRERLDEVAHRVYHALTRPYRIAGDEFVVGCSVGWVLAPPDARTADQLLALADRAMYHAKMSGGGVSGDSTGGMPVPALTERDLAAAPAR